MSFGGPQASILTILTGRRHAQTLPVPVGPVRLNFRASELVVHIFVSLV